MFRTHHVDGFHLLSGLISVVAGPIMLVTGTLPGWAIVVTVAGAIVLWAQWKIVKGEQVSFESRPGADHDHVSAEPITVGAAG